MLKERLDKFVMAYLDNIIIYFNTEKEHKENIPITVRKCKFYTKKINFIGFIIELKQISIDLKNIKAIVK